LWNFHAAIEGERRVIIDLFRHEGLNTFQHPPLVHNMIKILVKTNSSTTSVFHLKTVTDLQAKQPFFRLFDVEHGHTELIARHQGVCGVLLINQFSEN